MNKLSCAIVAAAGSGTRMGGVSKPNIELMGKTLFEYVLDAFEESIVDKIVVVCSEDNENSLKDLAKGYSKPISFVRGGKTRAESVFNGVSACEEGEIFCVHDCARPFIKAELINSLVLKAMETGASCVCTPVTDTVKFKDPETGLVSTPDRSNMFAVQTPQCFNKALYFNSRAKTQGFCHEFTDETSLLEHCGYEVSYIKNDNPNMKLTSKGDVALAEAIMKFKD